MAVDGVSCRLYATEGSESAPLVVCIAGAEFCAALCENSGCRVLCLDCDLSAQAVEAVARTIRSSGAPAVVGVKEGGNLAALAAHEVRDALACQILVQPALDAGVADSREWIGAPPALIITSELDPRRNEAEKYATRLEAFGVRVEWTCLDGAPDDGASEAIWLCAEHLRETFGLPVPIPITDVLDLHTVHPKEVRGVVGEYLREARRRGFRRVRIIHGRGIGVQREIVRAILARDPSVRSFSDAPPGAGGWGATLAEFR